MAVGLAAYTDGSEKNKSMGDGFPFYGLLGIPPTISISRLPPQVWHECPLLATAGTATSTTLVRTETIGRPLRTRATRTTPTASTSIRASPTGTTTTVTTVEVCVPSLALTPS